MFFNLFADTKLLIYLLLMMCNFFRNQAKIHWVASFQSTKKATIIIMKFYPFLSISCINLFRILKNVFVSPRFFWQIFLNAHFLYETSQGSHNNCFYLLSQGTNRLLILLSVLSFGREMFCHISNDI